MKRELADLMGRYQTAITDDIASHLHDKDYLAELVAQKDKQVFELEAVFEREKYR